MKYSNLTYPWNYCEIIHTIILALPVSRVVDTIGYIPDKPAAFLFKEIDPGCALSFFHIWYKTRDRGFYCKGTWRGTIAILFS
jgi:hypothetical protein